MIKRFFITFLFLSLAAPAFADDEERVINVEINKGAMIKLNAPVSSVVIADPSTADVQVVSARLIFVHGKKVGETSVYAIDPNDNTVFSATVNVTHNLSKLERTIKRVAPDADIAINTVDGGLIVDGTASSPVEAENISNVAASFLGEKEKMVNMIKTTGSDQVALDVKVVEMTRTDLKTLGINLQNVSSHGNFGLQVLQGANQLFFPNNTDTSPDTLQTYNSVLDRGSSTDSQILGRYKSISGVVDALETQGLATVLAEPNLTTTSGKTASFLAGGQFPIPVVQSSAGSAPIVTIQYQPFGVSLNFTPIVMSKDHISLTVAPEVSTLDFNNPIEVSGIRYPILDTRKASAVVELGSGESFMLAGLLQSNMTNSVNKFPGLGDIPVLGALFRSTQFQNNQTDLVIIVTPYIVHPVKSHKLQTPSDGYEPPSDLQRLLTGGLYRQQPMDKDKSKNTVETPLDQPQADHAQPDQNQPDEPQDAPMPKLHGQGGFITE